MKFTPEVLSIKSRINQFLQTSVRTAESSLLAKFGVHAMADFPPNILYMNGAFAGERAGHDLYFVDEVTNFGKALLCGLDFDLWMLEMLFFLAIDTAIQNTFVSMTIAYLLDELLVYYRAAEGQSNLTKKTIFDDRFFL